ncbi:hypothetical protein MVES1_002436 [Malassezia vespertilionis]|uniref:uncharacterized protein n=1 Tax=Malassezia vespertilionis TaxID=2020962 RepID=UPI0024B13F93|nr:uncharacterized protein MVES1_002436 [Malassezia vespertilionis]WFD07080.1 hypothetical protein MVES1_002436 [Malassezia vespertilionis]
MVYCKHWNEFKAQALALYARSPDVSRFVLKSRPNTETLILKVTDNHTVRRTALLTQTLKYRAKSTIILNRLDEFQKALLELMSNVKAPVDPSQMVTETVQKSAPLEAPKQAPPKGKGKKKGKKK